MSQEAVVEIITKAVVDNDFRQRLITKPETALAGYDLTAQEKEDFSKLTPENFDAFASELEQRVSKTGLLMNPGSITTPNTAGSYARRLK
jgi:hypothetical protein